jgi:hypothetical protein
MKLIRKFKLGHLYFKYVQGTPLEKTPFNTSKLLAAEMLRQGMIELYCENENEEIEITNTALNAHCYSYKTGMEPTKMELIKLLTKENAA